MTSDIGERLQAVRKIYGLSQRKLATRAGVTNSTISLIEQDRVSPSVDSLKKVLDGFPMSLIDFFTIDLTPQEPQFFRHDDLVELSESGVSLLLVGATRKDRKLRLLRETYPPGGHSGENLIAHKGEEAGFIIEGEIELSVGSEIRVLKEGDAYYIDTQTPHRFRNNSKKACVIVSAATPPNF